MRWHEHRLSTAGGLGFARCAVRLTVNGSRSCGPFYGSVEDRQVLFFEIPRRLSFLHFVSGMFLHFQTPRASGRPRTRSLNCGTVIVPPSNFRRKSACGSWYTSASPPPQRARFFVICLRQKRSEKADRNELPAMTDPFAQAAFAAASYRPVPRPGHVASISKSTEELSMMKGARGWSRSAKIPPTSSQMSLSERRIIADTSRVSGWARDAPV